MAPYKPKLGRIASGDEMPSPTLSAAASTNASVAASDHEEVSSVGSLRSSIHITHRSDRSTRTRVLQSSIKRVRPRLVRPSGKVPKGFSPELRAPEPVFDHCNVRQRQIANIRVYDINQRSKQTGEAFIPAQVHDLRHELKPIRTNDSLHHALSQIQSHEQNDVTTRDFAKTAPERKKPKHIYFFCGGGFQSPPSEQHWRFAAEVVHKCNTTFDVKTTVSIVSVPLAPATRITAAYEALEKLYTGILPSTPPGTPALSPTSPTSGLSPSASASDLSLKKTRTRYIKPEDEIIFMGDSSGGNIALSLTLHMLAQDPSARAPDALMLVSPVVDLTNENPDMREVTKRDPVMTLEYVSEVAKVWLGSDMKAEEALASPLHADVSELAFRKVKVHGVVAGDDVLAPDAMRLIEKLKRSSVQGRWLVWKKMMHCFPLAQQYGLPEAKVGAEWILDTLLGRV